MGRGPDSVAPMAQRTVSQTVVAAPPGAVLDVVADLEAYPEWAKGVTRVSVLESDARGRPRRARFVADAGVLRDTYVLVYSWDVAPDGVGVVSWSLDEAGALRALDGSYTIEDDPAGSRVAYRLSVEPIVPVPPFVRARMERSVVSTALEALRERAQGSARPGDARS